MKRPLNELQHSLNETKNALNQLKKTVLREVHYVLFRRNTALEKKTRRLLIMEVRLMVGHKKPISDGAYWQA